MSRTLKWMQCSNGRPVELLEDGGDVFSVAGVAE